MQVGSTKCSFEKTSRPGNSPGSASSSVLLQDRLYYLKLLATRIDCLRGSWMPTWLPDQRWLPAARNESRDRQFR